MGQTGQNDPSVFNPDRMMEEDGVKPGAQMYFGYGPRWVHTIARDNWQQQLFGPVVSAACLQIAGSKNEAALGAPAVPLWLVSG